jgi:hypothetical protein
MDNTVIQDTIEVMEDGYCGALWPWQCSIWIERTDLCVDLYTIQFANVIISISVSFRYGTGVMAVLALH